MKKTFIAAVAALSIFVPASLHAEDAAKEYNMVITLQNGTTITLGHNDIKNITFNGEEISISGNVVDTIEELNKKSAEALDRTYMLEDMLHAELSEVYMQVEQQNEIITSLTNIQDDLRAEMEDRYAQLMSHVDYLDYRIEALEQSENDTKTDVEELKAYADQLRALIEEVRAQLGI